MEKQIEIDFEATVKKLEVILNKKKQRMEDATKAENKKKVERIDKEIERKQKEIERKQKEIQELEEEKRNIQEGEGIQLNEIGNEIAIEKNDYLLALMDDIEIQKALKGFRKKLNKYK